MLMTIIGIAAIVGVIYFGLGKPSFLELIKSVVGIALVAGIVIGVVILALPVIVILGILGLPGVIILIILLGIDW